MTTVAEFYSNPHIGLRFGVKNANHTSAIGHSGQDINGWREGTWIPAFSSGRVVNKVPDGGAFNKRDLGNFIVIESVIGGVRYFVTYCHLASFGGTPEIGDPVVFGQGVGPIGNTGYSFGTHLHAMMSTTSMYPTTRVNLVDPLPFIYAARAGTAGGGGEPIPEPEPEPEPEPIPEEEDDMPKNAAIWYVNANNKAVMKIFNTGSGFESEYSSSDATPPGELNGQMARIFDMPVADWPKVSKEYAALLSQSLAAVRATGGGGSVTVEAPNYTAILKSDGVPGNITGTLTPQ